MSETLTYNDFDEIYKDCVEDFIHNLNNQLGTNLLCQDFGDYFYKMESLVLSEVNIEDEE